MSHRRRSQALSVEGASDMRLTLLSPGNRVHNPLGGAVSRYWDDELLLLQEPAGQDNLDDCGDRFRASPVALELAGQRDPADRLAPCLRHPVKAGAAGLGRGGSDRIGDRLHLMSLAVRRVRQRPWLLRSTGRRC